MQCWKLRGRGGMVDATDLKSVFRKEVRVRVPPPAPGFTVRVKPALRSEAKTGHAQNYSNLFSQVVA
jgi:hypothetical protein